MNRNSHPDVSYRLLFLGRHGEGYHNVAEDEYGTEAWDVRVSLPLQFHKYEHIPNQPLFVLCYMYSVTGPSKPATKT